MALLTKSQGEYAQNDATDKQLRASEGESQGGSDDLLRSLAKTVKELAGPSGALQTLTNSVKNLQNDMQDMKRKRRTGKKDKNGQCSSLC